MFKFPCEVVIQFVLPSMRKEMVSYLVNEKAIRQREVARMMGITDAAVSQYIKGKRGNYFKFDEKTKGKIHKISDTLVDHYKEHKQHNGSEFMVDACNMCRELRSSKALCLLHKELGMDISNCMACKEPKN